MIKNLPDRIFLCGFMGAGKSTVARALAARLNLSFLDLDEAIEEHAGITIPEIFEQEGEAGFRKRERRSLLDAINRFKGVVALGGGTLQNQHIVDHVKLNGLLIFIETPISVILKRLSGSANRPLLLGEDGKRKSTGELSDYVTDLYQERLPLYEQSVLRIGSEDYESTVQLVEELIKKIRYHVSY